MESYGLDMEDIFDTAADVDDDQDVVQRSMPDLEDDEEPANGNVEEAAEDGGEGTDADVLSKLKDLSKGAAKKRVLKPQPKLDLERLQSKRGLRELPKVFQGVKFKGKGHEADDLELLMGKLEHWAHRLFPKLPFDDFVERLEKLGTKKPVQTCLKRIRLDMDDYGDDIIRGENEEEEEEGREEPKDGATAAADKFTDLDAEEAYEEMMREERVLAEKRKQTEEGWDVPQTPGKKQSSQAGDRSPAQSQSAASNSQSPATTKSPSTSQPPKTGGMTAEQVARMERNRQLAIERRLAKLGKSPGPGSKLPSSSRADSGNTPRPSQDQIAARSPATSQPIKSQDQGTVEELEAMLDEDAEKVAESTGSETRTVLDLHLTETQSEGTVTQDNAQRSRTGGTQGSEQLKLQMTATESGSEMSEDGLVLKMTATESEYTNKDGKQSEELVLQMTATESEDTNKDGKQSEELVLQMTATETESDDRSKSGTEKLDLRLSESETAGEQSEDLDLRLSESKDTEVTQTVPTEGRKESDSDDLQLKMSASEDESGADM